MNTVKARYSYQSQAIDGAYEPSLSPTHDTTFHDGLEIDTS